MGHRRGVSLGRNVRLSHQIGMQRDPITSGWVSELLQHLVKLSMMPSFEGFRALVKMSGGGQDRGPAAELWRLFPRSD